MPSRLRVPNAVVTVVSDVLPSVGSMMVQTVWAGSSTMAWMVSPVVRAGRLMSCCCQTRGARWVPAARPRVR